MRYYETGSIPMISVRTPLPMKILRFYETLMRNRRHIIESSLGHATGQNSVTTRSFALLHPFSHTGLNKCEADGWIMKRRENMKMHRYQFLILLFISIAALALT